MKISRHHIHGYPGVHAEVAYDDHAERWMASVGTEHASSSGGMTYHESKEVATGRAHEWAKSLLPLVVEYRRRVVREAEDHLHEAEQALNKSKDDDDDS
jgi:hypothetical protein